MTPFTSTSFKMQECLKSHASPASRYPTPSLHIFHRHPSISVYIPRAPNAHCHVHPTPHYHMHPKPIAMCTPHPIASCNLHPPHVHLIRAQPQTSLTPPPHRYHMRPPYYYTLPTLSLHVFHPHLLTHLYRHTTYLSHICTSQPSPTCTSTRIPKCTLYCITTCTSYMFLHVPLTHTYMYLTHRPPHTPQTDQGRSSP